MNQPLFNALFDENERKPLTVSQLTNSIRISLEGRFASVWVEGEISNFKDHSSGHWYFTLKDQNAQLRAKCFRSTNTRIRFRPANGLHVRARGKLSVYAPRGEGRTPAGGPPGRGGGGGVGVWVGKKGGGFERGIFFRKKTGPPPPRFS